MQQELTQMTMNESILALDTAEIGWYSVEYIVYNYELKSFIIRRNVAYGTPAKVISNSVLRDEQNKEIFYSIREMHRIKGT